MRQLLVYQDKLIKCFFHIYLQPIFYVKIKYNFDKLLLINRASCNENKVVAYVASGHASAQISHLTRLLLCSKVNPYHQHKLPNRLTDIVLKIPSIFVLKVTQFVLIY